MILITGGNGWIGLNLLNELSEDSKNIWMQKNNKICALVLPNSSIDKVKSINSKIECIFGDIRNIYSLEDIFKKNKINLIIHTAGVIHPRKVKDFYENNLLGTKNLLYLANKYKVKKTVLLSSNSPFGFNEDKNKYFNEESDYKPYMNYGMSKMKMESVAFDFIKKYDSNITIIRAPWFYGPHQPLRQKRFYEMIRKGTVPIVGNGENLRSMVNTKNLCEGILLSTKTPKAKGKVYWIADSNPYSMNYIISTIRDLMIKELGIKCNLGIRRLPNAVSSIAQFLDGSIQKLGFYNQELHVLSEMNKNIACSIDLARKELSYNPRISLKYGMLEALKEVYGG